MSEEKRIIDKYEVKQSIFIGGKEFILAEDTIKNSDEKYMTCVATRNNILGLEEYRNALAGDNYLEMFQIFSERIAALGNELYKNQQENGLSCIPLTIKDCIKGGLDNNIEGKIIVIKPETLSPEYRTPIHQLVLAMNGSGCRPNNRGNAVFCKELYTGMEMRYEKYNVASVINPEKLPEWAKLKITEINKEATKDKKSLLESVENGKKAVPRKSAAVQDNEKKKNENII